MVKRSLRDALALARTSPGASERTASARGKGHRKGSGGGLRGSLDAPAPGDYVSSEVHVAGWAFHPHREVIGIVVTVNGRVAGASAPKNPRPDVAKQLSEGDAALMSGWATTIELTQSDGADLELQTFAVLAQQGDHGESVSLGKSVPLQSVSVRRPDAAQVGGGPLGVDRPSARFLEREDMTLGYNRLQGLVDVPGEVSRAEITLDGVATGLARTSLPGHSFRADRQPSATIAMFEAGVFVDEAGEVEIGGTIECIDGTRIAIDSMILEVGQSKSSGPSGERLELVRQRVAERGTESAPTTPLAQGVTPPVLVLTHDLGLGGGQLWLHELVVRLSARGVPMAIASPRGGVLLESMEDLGIPVLVTGSLDSDNAEAYEAQVLLVVEWARQHGCQIAVANTMSAFVGVDAAQRLGLPVAWAIHESFPLSQFWVEAFPPPLPAYAAERGQRSLGLVDLAVFEAEATLELYAPHLADGVGQTVPYGVDFSEIDRYVRDTDRAALRNDLGLADSTLVLLCIGTIEPRKAQINLAQAFLGSETLRDADVALLFVGAQAGSPYVAALEDYVASMDDANRVRIEPVQPDIYQWYHAADVLLCASDVESLPRSMLEAMAFGTPVASTAVFGVPELITDGHTGYLCEPRDLAALRGLLERTVATPPADIEAMGFRARELVHRRHDPSIYVDYFLGWLQTTTGRPQS